MVEGKKAIFVDLEHCLGCKSCEIACTVEHSQTKNIFSAAFENPLPCSRVKVEPAGQGSLPMQCRQCEEAPCLRVCPSGAINRGKNDVVVFDPEICVGCYMCTMVCPFGAITSEKNHKIALKCDLCPDLSEPACVKACPVKALIYDTLDNVNKQKRTKLINLTIEKK